AEVIMWDDFLLEGATAVDRVDTWQILNHNVEETLKLATTGRFKSLIYSTDFVISDLGTGYGNDWVKFYYVRLLNDKKGVIKGGEAVVWESEDNYDSHFVFELQANGGPVQQGDLDFVLDTFAFKKFTATPSHPVAVSVEYDVGLLDEAYEFTCTPQLCHLKFSSRSGFFYGTVTAFQISHNHADGLTSIINTGFNITDYPSFPHRGMLIDTGRRYPPVDLIKKNLRTMASMK
ncbi:hypothetical protein FOZ61_000247, partial [Perkinsus olseni]